MTDTPHFHPLAAIFPLLDETSEDFQALRDDIRDNGLREPIVLYQQQILDGRNRFSACVLTGTEPTYDTATTDQWTDEQARAYVMSKNLHRRHLTLEQRDAMLRKLRGQKMTIEDIARLTHLSKSTVGRVVKDLNSNDGNSLRRPDTIVNARGQMRPSSYQSHRPLEPEPESRTIHVNRIVTPPREPQTVKVWRVEPSEPPEPRRLVVHVRPTPPIPNDIIANIHQQDDPEEHRRNLLKALVEDGYADQVEGADADHYRRLKEVMDDWDQ